MEIPSRLRAAVRHFWSTRQRQSRSQGREGQRDYGQRTAVTGGKQLDGFVSLLSDLLVESGVAADSVLSNRRIELPGYFRPEKQWDLVLVIDGQLVGAVELKSHIGPSFGNNFNNRTEEAIGTSTDLLTAYRDGAFKPGARPWLGYLMLLEEHPRSLAKRQRYQEPHFAVFPEFRDTSYADRYVILLTKLLREGLYDGACFLTSSRADGLRGAYREPSAELSFANFAQLLLARAIAARLTKR